ncbi:MAG: creatininase family protein [Candidatus Hodarchaeales archaeon]
MATLRMEDMNWMDIKEVINKGYTTVVIGIGSTEQHGPHLPTSTDSFWGDIYANRVTSSLKNALQAPTIRVGCSDHHLSFPGTISLRPSTLKAVINDYVNSLVKHGFKRIVLLPSHGGNFTPVQEVTKELQREHPEMKIVAYADLMKFFDFINGVAAEFGITEEEAGAHSGEAETSIMLALARNLVKEDRFATGYLGTMGSKEIQLVMEKGMTALTKNGILGDPTKATAERGKIYLERIVGIIVEEINKQLS